MNGPCQIMGVLNVTPDSFSDGGRFMSPTSALSQFKCFCNEGADIVDIGAESTKPGSKPVDAQVQIDRIAPVLDLIKSLQHDVKISIDTQSPKVLSALLPYGIDIINDVNALQADGMVELAARHNLDAVLMHKQGSTQTMQHNPKYHNVCDEVMSFFEKKIHDCLKKGMHIEQIIVDPGIGFGKTLEHNLALLQNLPNFYKLGCRILIGLSRKSMLGALTGADVGERLCASIGGALAAVQKGAHIIRVHDVKETHQALQVFYAVTR